MDKLKLRKTYSSHHVPHNWLWIWLRGVEETKPLSGRFRPLRWWRRHGERRLLWGLPVVSHRLMLRGRNPPGLVDLQTTGLLDVGVTMPVRDTAGIPYVQGGRAPRVHCSHWSQHFPLQTLPKHPLPQPPECQLPSLFIPLLSVEASLNKTLSR